MDEPQLLAVLIVIAFFFITLFGGGYLIYRTMNRPNSYIGARMHAEEQRRLQEEQSGAGSAAPGAGGTTSDAGGTAWGAGATGPASATDPASADGEHDVPSPRGPEDQQPER